MIESEIINPPNNNELLTDIIDWIKKKCVNNNNFINTYRHNGKTLLTIYNYNDDVVDFLLDNGSDIYFLNRDETSVLSHWSGIKISRFVNSRFFDMLKITFDRDILHILAKHYELFDEKKDIQEKILNYIIKCCNQTNNINVFIRIACTNFPKLSFEIVKKLKIDIYQRFHDSNYSYLIYILTYCTKYSVIDEILKTKPNLNYIDNYGSHLFENIIRDRNYQTLKMIIDKININYFNEKKGLYLLNIIIDLCNEYKYYDIIDFFLEKKDTIINYNNKDDSNILFSAINCNKNIFNKILKLTDKNINHTNLNGETSLFYLSPDVMSISDIDNILSICDINIVDNNGNTFLFNIIKKSTYFEEEKNEIEYDNKIKYILEKSKNIIYHKNKNQESVLYVAAMTYNFENVLEYYDIKQINEEIKENNGIIFLKIAKQKKHIIKSLNERGLKITEELFKILMDTYDEEINNDTLQYIISICDDIIGNLKKKMTKIDILKIKPKILLKFFKFFKIKNFIKQNDEINNLSIIVELFLSEIIESESISNNMLLLLQLSNEDNFIELLLSIYNNNSAYKLLLKNIENQTTLDLNTTILNLLIKNNKNDIYTKYIQTMYSAYIIHVNYIFDTQDTKNSIYDSIIHNNYDMLYKLYNDNKTLVIEMLQNYRNNVKYDILINLHINKLIPNFRDIFDKKYLRNRCLSNLDKNPLFFIYFYENYLSLNTDFDFTVKCNNPYIIKLLNAAHQSKFGTNYIEISDNELENEIKKFILRTSRFGVEIETYWHKNGNITTVFKNSFPQLENKYYYSPTDVYYNKTPTKKQQMRWMCTNDASLSSKYDDRYGKEFVSPVYYMGNSNHKYVTIEHNQKLKNKNNAYLSLNINNSSEGYYEGLSLLGIQHKNFLFNAKDKEYSYIIDSTCALHVHMSNIISDMNDSTSKKTIQVFLTCWYHLEPLLLLLVKLSSRLDNRYCSPMHYNNNTNKYDNTLESTLNLIDSPEKYYAVNLCYSKTNDKYNSHIEIRLYHSTTDIIEIYNWTMLMLVLYTNCIYLATTLYEKIENLYNEIISHIEFTVQDIFDLDNININKIQKAYDYFFDNFINCKKLKKYYVDHIKKINNIKIKYNKNKNINIFDLDEISLPESKNIIGGYIQENNIDSEIKMFKLKSPGNFFYDNNQDIIYENTPYGSFNILDNDIIVEFANHIRKIEMYNHKILLKFLSDHGYLHPIYLYSCHQVNKTDISNLFRKQGYNLDIILKIIEKEFHHDVLVYHHSVEQYSKCLYIKHNNAKRDEQISKINNESKIVINKHADKQDLQSKRMVGGKKYVYIQSRFY